MPIFSLKQVSKLQVQNVSENTFKYWSEGATYGYFGGGDSPFATPAVCNIYRMDFFTDTTNDSLINLPAIKTGMSAVSNASYGYFGGGSSPLGNFCTLSRLDFSNDSVSLPGKNFPAIRVYSAAVSSSSYGYFGGGYSPPLNSLNTISRLDFTSETATSLTSVFPVPFHDSAPTGVSNKSYGYFGGGYSSAAPAVMRCNISRLDFSSETASAPGKNLSSARRSVGAVFSDSDGYFGGGYLIPNTILTTIDKLNFDTETISSTVASFPLSRRLSTGVASRDYGYFGGGKALPAASLYSNIVRLNFATSTVSIPSSNFTNAHFSQSSFSGGQSIFKPKGGGSKTYGYYAGGQSFSNSLPYPLLTVSWVLRLDFSTETVTDNSKYMQSARRNAGSSSSNYYGYFAGGLTPSATQGIERIDFTTEFFTALSNSLPSTRSGLAGFQNNSYGYFSGGSGPSPIINTITRLDFSNETVSNPGKDLPASTTSHATISSSSYGYTGGGDASGLTNVVRRFDFSNETLSTPGKNLPSTGIYQFATTSNNFYGYFGGGKTSLIYVCEITRLDFSSETISSPGKNLPAAKDQLSGTSSNFYGYFGGGYFTPAATYYNVVTRLDFSTENTSNITSQFTGGGIASGTKLNAATVSNSN